MRLILITLAAAAVPLAAAADEDKTAEICAEADARYVELFGAPPAEEEGIHVVLMYDYTFCPPKIDVKLGETVRWINVDKRTSHSVIVGSAPESDRVFPEEQIEFTFEEPGEHRYLCGPHWERRDMIGWVSVTE